MIGVLALVALILAELLREDLSPSCRHVEERRAVLEEWRAERDMLVPTERTVER